MSIVSSVNNSIGQKSLVDDCEPLTDTERVFSDRQIGKEHGQSRRLAARGRAAAGPAVVPFEPEAKCDIRRRE